MRTAIFLGLLFIAWAINPDLLGPFVNKSVALIFFTIALAAMDTLEFLIKIIKAAK